MKIFVLKGVRSCGKTSVLKETIIKVLKQYNAVFVDSGGNRLDADGLKSRADLLGTITVRDKTIAVNTSGDTRAHLDETVNLFGKGANIGLCAVRSSGATCRKINEFAQAHGLIDGVDCFVICKLYFGNFGATTNAALIQKVNELQSQWLFNEVCQCL